MKLLKLHHNYHDAVLRSVEIRDQTVTLVVDLDPHWNNKVAEQRHLFFQGVRNLDEVRGALGLGPQQSRSDVGVQIIGIVRGDDGQYLVDLTKLGTLHIDCKTLGET